MKRVIANAALFLWAAITIAVSLCVSPIVLLGIVAKAIGEWMFDRGDDLHESLRRWEASQ